MKVASCFFSILILATIAQGQQNQFIGDVVGKVVDSHTQQSLPAVNVVVVELPATGASTDIEGSFRISGLPVGTYSLRFSSVGYDARVLTNVVVTTGRATPVSIRLDESPVEVGTVVVQASYFGRGQQLSPISTNQVDRSEILRMPGSVQDVQRVVQSLPGVASSTDNINELIVRGGAPFENLTVMDDMEIHSINHYSNQFNSAGPINMVNADMIEDVQFSAGGFPAKFGDKSSSVLNITLRQGDRSRTLASKSGFSMAGIGTLLEGRIGDRGSFIFSARNSLLEVVDKLVGIGTVSLTAIPRYWDSQGKVVFDLTPTQTLSVNYVYGDSRISFDGTPDEQDDQRRNSTDSSSVERLNPVNKQYAVGATLRSLWGKEGFSLLTAYVSGSSGDVKVYRDFYRRVYDTHGEVSSRDLMTSRLFFQNTSSESFAALKYEVVYDLTPSHQVNAGLAAGTTVSWKNEAFIASDTARFDLNGDGLFETPQRVIPDGRFTQKLTFGDAARAFFFVSDRMKLVTDLHLTLGLRYDQFTYSGQRSITPRASLSWHIVPPTTVLTLAAGIYDQTQPFPYYSDRFRSNVNRNLANMRARHLVFGVEHVLDDGLKLSAETYYKDYSNVVVSEEFVHSADPTFTSERNLAIGERRSYGLEFFVQQKQVADWYGTMSLSLSRTRDKDPRRPPVVGWYASSYDYPVVATVLAGKVVKGVRDWLDDAPFFIKYPSVIFPLSNEMEISFKYRYQTGRPYTPVDFVTWQQVREGGVKWSKGVWRGSSRVNSARYSDYSRLDVQWLSRFYWRTWNINVYVALQNVLDTRNVFYENLRSDGTKQTVYQFAFFPVGGVEVEF